MPVQSCQGAGAARPSTLTAPRPNGAARHGEVDGALAERVLGAGRLVGRLPDGEGDQVQGHRAAGGVLPRRRAGCGADGRTEVGGQTGRLPRRTDQQRHPGLPTVVGTHDGGHRDPHPVTGRPHDEPPAGGQRRPVGDGCGARRREPPREVGRVARAAGHRAPAVDVLEDRGVEPEELDARPSVDDTRTEPAARSTG